MHPKILAIFFASVISVSVIDMIRRRKMTFKYSLGWLSACLVVIFFSANDYFLKHVSKFFGFALPSNFIFFLLLIFVIFLSLLLTVYTSEQNSRLEAIAQALAIFEYQGKKTKREGPLSGQDPARPSGKEA